MFKLVKSEHLIPRYFLGEEAQFGKDNWVPNRVERERHCGRLIKNRVHELHWEIVTLGSLQQKLILLEGPDFPTMKSM